MEKIIYKAIEIWTSAASFFIGLFKGNEIKRKWVYKMNASLNQKRRISEQRTLLANGIVPLDDIEMASYHKS